MRGELAVTRWNPYGDDWAERPGHRRPWVSGQDWCRIVELERENRELRLAVAVLKARVIAGNRRRARSSLPDTPP